MPTSDHKPIHVSVLECDPLRLVGLQAVFASEPDIELRAATVDTVLHSRHEEVVLMAADRGASFQSAMSALKAVRPGIRIIVIGPGKRGDDILRAVSAGAKGYVPQEAPSEVLTKAVREVHKGAVWVPRRVLATFIERATAPAHPRPQRTAAKISEREREVLRLLVAGCSNREIALELGIIERTVKAHVAHLLRKIGAPNRIALTMRAVAQSLLAPEK